MQGMGMGGPEAGGGGPPGGMPDMNQMMQMMQGMGMGGGMPGAGGGGMRMPPGMPRGMMKRRR